jgi:methionine biosynthesis protein MetW
MIDNPGLNDNRKYDYSSSEHQFRDEYPIIVEIIPKHSTVVDFGCGNGSLLELLISEKSVNGIGYEISESGIDACSKKGIKAVCTSIDQYHEELQAKQFDYAICNVTLQMVLYPEILLREMIRVSKYQIISFPNFAFYKNRLDMLIHGRMPRPMLFDYRWNSTGHIHQFSSADFCDLIREIGNVRIINSYHANSRNPFKKILRRIFPNLFEFIPIYLLESMSHE